FSFVAYFLLLLLFSSALKPPLFQNWPIWSFSSAVAALAIALELGMLFYRPVAACQPFGIHYPRPYPALLDKRMKTTFNFGDWSFIRSFISTGVVALEIDDPWIQSFAKMLLISHHVPFCVRPPVYESREPSPVIAPIYECP